MPDQFWQRKMIQPGYKSGMRIIRLDLTHWLNPDKILLGTIQFQQKSFEIAWK